MKTLITFLSLSFVSVAALALGNPDMPNNPGSVVPVEASLVSVKVSRPNCPKGAVCESRLLATLKVTLASCVNKLGPVSYTTRRMDDGKTEIIVSAVEIVSKDSLRVRCVIAEVKTFTIPLGLGYASKDSVVVTNLRTQAQPN